MMIGSKSPSDALARQLETLIDPSNTNGVIIFHRKMTRAESVLAVHRTRSVRAANHQLGAKHLLTPAYIIRIQNRFNNNKSSVKKSIRLRSIFM